MCIPNVLMGIIRYISKEKTFAIVVFKKKTRKATGFKSLRVNLWKINQVTSKCKMDFLGKTCRKGLKQKK